MRFSFDSFIPSFRLDNSSWKAAGMLGGGGNYTQPPLQMNCSHTEYFIVFIALCNVDIIVSRREKVRCVSVLLKSVLGFLSFSLDFVSTKKIFK